MNAIYQANRYMGIVHSWKRTGLYIKLIKTETYGLASELNGSQMWETANID